MIDADGSPKHILTQLDIIRHLKAHPELLPAKIDSEKTLKDLGLFSRNDVTLVKESTITISAYRLMAENRFTSVVVIDRYKISP